jgi:Glycosyltransferase 61
VNEHSEHVGEGLAIDIINRRPSVEHYYHFVLGFLVPLVRRIATEVENESRNIIYVRSCGPLDGLIREVLPDNITILPKRHHDRLLDEARSSSKSKLHHEVIYGYDHPQYYDAATFKVVKLALEARLSEQLNAEERRFIEEHPTPGPRVIFIDRGKPHNFYSSGASEIKTSGRERRSIPNFSECIDFLSSQKLHVDPCLLEEKSLVFQMALFRSSDIIIAQHGAALTNLIWASDNLDVIEIIPRDLERQSNHFETLTRCLGQRYHMINQDQSHSAIDPHLLSRHLSEIWHERFGTKRSATSLDRIRRFLRLPHRPLNLQ